MNINQENKFSMEVALRDFLSQNATITTSLPNFRTLFSSFSENMDKIQVIRELQEADKSGIAQSKEQLRSDLIGKALDISQKIQAYAKMTENTILTSSVPSCRNPVWVLRKRNRRPGNWPGFLKPMISYWTS